MLVSADDDGRLEGDTISIKMKCCPGLDITNDDIAESLTRLHLIGLIEWYEVDYEDYVQVSNWEENQRFHGWTRYPSTYPSSNDGSPNIQKNGEPTSPNKGEIG